MAAEEAPRKAATTAATRKTPRNLRRDDMVVNAESGHKTLSMRARVTWERWRITKLAQVLLLLMLLPLLPLYSSRCTLLLTAMAMAMARNG